MNKLTFLFWNINSQPLLEIIAAIVRQHSVDVLVLAESGLPIPDLLEELNAGERAKFSYPFDPSGQLTILIKLPRASLHLVRDTGGIAIRRLVPPIGKDFLLVALHLPSKLYMTDADQALLCTRLSRYILEAEEKVGHTRTVVVGDFNMNPFEYGIVGSEGLHAVMDKSIAAKTSRIVQGEERHFFYNPMWNYFGDASPNPSGTYYYSSSAPITYFWNIFDQILIRPSLLESFSNDDLEIITAAGSTKLLSSSKIPDKRVGSDHLPILFRLDLLKELE